jgi:hypothetical protein
MSGAILRRIQTRSVCPARGGVTWSTSVAVADSDFGRVSVGGDAFVYVAYVDASNLMLHKFWNCDWGLAPQVGWPITVFAYNRVVCPEPSLDRCNGSNSLASPKVVVDDLNPQHVY